MLRPTLFFVTVTGIISLPLSRSRK